MDLLLLPPCCAVTSHLSLSATTPEQQRTDSHMTVSWSTPKSNRNYIIFPHFFFLRQHSLQNEGHTETPDFLVVTLSSCLRQGKSVTQALPLLYSFILCRLVAGGMMIFSAVPRFFHLKQTDSNTDHSVSTGQEKGLHASLCHIDAVRSGMKAE